MTYNVFGGMLNLAQSNDIMPVKHNHQHDSPTAKGARYRLWHLLTLALDIIGNTVITCIGISLFSSVAGKW